jgi:hypothetical protein
MDCCKEDMAKKEYEYDNSYLVEEFMVYPLYGMACDDYPWIDDIITGVANLDLGGNTRPLSRNMLYVLISTQPVIKTSLIMEATGKSQSYCKKLVMLLRIACRALECELRFRNAQNKDHCKEVWRNACY